jgi:hypothetical protein
MRMMEGVARTKGDEAEWEANRTYALDHLVDARHSAERALNGLTRGDREPTRDARVATVETQRKHILAMASELQRLRSAVDAAETRAATAEAARARGTVSQPRAGKELADGVRRVVMWAVHPDRAANAEERQWRTKLCQTLFPEMDKAIGRT